jgi:predicted MFS family arabinose efflux permease
MPRVSRPARLALAGAAFLALADTGVVALALPPILRQLDTTVAGVSAVLGVYALVLAGGLLLAARLRARVGLRLLGVAGIALFVLGSLVAGVAESLGLLLVARGVQALGGAGVLVAAYALLADDGEGTRLWRAAALIGTAAGPALGGALTQAFGWRSIFLLQAPAALAALPACLGAREPTTSRPEPGARAEHEADAPGAAATGAGTARAEADATIRDEHVPAGATALPLLALALLSGALAAALFLTVLLLVSGWSVEPLPAALVVSAVPLAGLAGLRAGGAAATRAVYGCLLAAGGSAALAFLPDATVAWTLPPLALVGFGMGLALPALAGELLPERSSRQAARLLSVRHLGIAFVVAVLALIAQHQLNATLDTTRERGAALILDASIDPTTKLELAPQLVQTVKTEDPRGGLQRAFADKRDGVSDDDLGAYDRLERRADETLVAAVIDGFEPAYLAGALMALLAALALVADPRPRPALLHRRGLSLSTAVLVLLLPAVYAGAAAHDAPAKVRIADPCKQRRLPAAGGISGFVQDTALATVDRAACRAGSSREELVLALVDSEQADRYQRRYGIDPRSVIDLAQLVLGG